jgi:PAS domain S-box-containing protein
MNAPRILIIKNTPGFLASLSQVLQGVGYVVMEVNTPNECSEVVRERLPDLVLLDFEVADSKGVDVCKQIKADARTAAVRVIHVSGSDSPTRFREERLECGADCFLARHIEGPELMEHVNALLLMKRTEEALAKGDRHFRGTFDSAKYAMLLVDDKASCIDANPIACSLFGLPREQILKRSLQDLCKPGLYWEAETEWQEFLRNGREDGSFRLHRFDGTKVDVEYHAKAGICLNSHLWLLQDVTEKKRFEETLQQVHEKLEYRVAQRTAELVAANAFLRDEIVERKRAESLLKAATNDWEQTFDAITNHVCIVDMSGRIVRANEAMRECFEPQLGALIGRGFVSCYYGDESPGDELPLHAVLNEQKHLKLETRVPALKGWCLIASYPLFDSYGQQRGAVCSVSDITARKRAQEALQASEEQLRQAEEKYRGIYENAMDGIFQTSPDGRFIAANPAMARMIGYENPEDLMAARTNIEQTHYVDAERRKEFLRVMAEEGVVQNFELQVYRKDGSKIWTSENVRAVRDDSGALLYFEGIVEDITQRKQVEAERLQLLRRLITTQEDAQRRISRELHDQMGQSLAALMLGLKSLSDHAKTPEITTRLQQLQNLTTQLAQDVHRLARELRPTALDDLGLHTALSNYIDEWSERTGVTADFHSNGLLSQRLPNDIETTAYRIVQESLTNVMKHAKAENVSIIVEHRGNRVLVIVEDDGSGFDPEVPSKNGSRNGRLGLIGMQERVALAGGTLNIESSAGGTTVLAHIPISRNQVELDNHE